jgi:metal-sulfur cluster biosynthetic enzyme
MITQTEVESAISTVGHPAINYSLVKLGIVSNILLLGKKVIVEFAFPFPNIPIADKLIGSIEGPIQNLGLSFEHTVRTMDEEEKSKFLQLETEAWKG